MKKDREKKILHEAVKVVDLLVRIRFEECLCAEAKKYSTSWVDKLSAVLWAYRTMPHILTGPFSFTYGAEALIPVEIVEASPRVSFDNADLNREALGVAKHLLDEHRHDVSIRNACYKQRMARYHNRRVKEQIFQVGDLVLRRIEATWKHVRKLFFSCPSECGKSSAQAPTNSLNRRRGVQVVIKHTFCAQQPLRSEHKFEDVILLFLRVRLATILDLSTSRRIDRAIPCIKTNTWKAWQKG